MDNRALVLKAFKAGKDPLSAGQIATKCGIERKEVDKIMTALKKESLIVSPKPCHWTLA